MTSFDGGWTWTDAQRMIFEASSAPDRLLSTDLGPQAARDDFQAFCMKQALRESCERVAMLLNEAGLSLDDVQHLDPNRQRVQQLGKMLEDDSI